MLLATVQDLVSTYFPSNGFTVLTAGQVKVPLFKRCCHFAC